MARVLGYGGIANTNGARDFSTKVEAVGITGRIRNITSRYTRPWEISVWLLISRIFTNG